MDGPDDIVTQAVGIVWIMFVMGKCVTAGIKCIDSSGTCSKPDYPGLVFKDGVDKTVAQTV